MTPRASRHTRHKTHFIFICGEFRIFPYSFGELDRRESREWREIDRVIYLRVKSEKRLTHMTGLTILTRSSPSSGGETLRSGGESRAGPESNWRRGDRARVSLSLSLKFILNIQL